MMEFLETCLSFPVNIFSGLLIISALYWLVASFGLLDIDSLDIDIDPGGGDLDIGGDLDLGDLGDAGDVGDIGDAGGGAAGGMGVLASLLFQLGLYGVPMTLIITLISIFGWLITYYGVHWGLAVIFSPGPLRYLLGALLFALALFLAALLTSVAIKPLRRFFKKAEETTAQSIRGRLVLIRSSQVTDTYGEAVYEEGGTTLLLDVRPARPGQVFKRGDRAVILDYDPLSRIYSIITEDEFGGR